MVLGVQLTAGFSARSSEDSAEHGDLRRSQMKWSDLLTTTEEARLNQFRSVKGANLEILI